MPSCAPFLLTTRPPLHNAAKLATLVGRQPGIKLHRCRDPRILLRRNPRARHGTLLHRVGQGGRSQVWLSDLQQFLHLQVLLEDAPLLFDTVQRQAPRRDG